ncbi:MAG TPA: OmpA family protein [Alphaproteobacteria bacterium]|nr:OmpA family protein [Alphaproteobacteria bacterium]
MSRSTTLLRTAVAALALSVATGCAQDASPPATAAATTGPELAGAWYQIYFDSNGAEINARGRTIVQTVAYVVANAGPTRVTVIGKTDRVGAPSANMALAQQRADVVRDALISAGVPAASIDTNWTGEGRQEVATANQVAEQRNRVVDVTVVKLPR